MSEKNNAQAVLLLHGLVRTRFSMRRIQRALDEAGYVTLAESYPSRSRDIQSLARWLAPRFADYRARYHRVHLLGHSLGGIIARALLRADPRADPASLVMLGPPNRGSALAERLFEKGLLRWFYGPAGQDLRSPKVIEAICAQPQCPTLIIAGTRGFDPRNPTSYIGRRLLEAPHDGTVTVAETTLEGPNIEHCQVDETHTFLPSNHASIEHALRFFATLDARAC
jgi:pimeloyl-ACP methyl ester carboxylesterase